VSCRVESQTVPRRLVLKAARKRVQNECSLAVPGSTIGVGSQYQPGALSGARWSVDLNRTFSLFVGLMFVAGCSSDHPRNRLIGPPTPTVPSLTLGQLYGSPTSLVVDGMPFSVDVGLFGDYQPHPGVEGSPIRVSVPLNGSPPGTYPPTMSDVYVWAIRNSSEVWSQTTHVGVENWDGAGGRIYWSDGGPPWDADKLDVVVGVRTFRTVSYVLFRDVPIRKVY
jgi:hypothetical protein